MLIKVARISATVLALFATAAGALSVQVEAGQEECFHHSVERVTKHKIITSFEVISGGITADLRITGPDNKLYHEVKSREQDRYLFEPEQAGLYTLCFSTSSAGAIGFSIHPEDEEYPDVALKGRSSLNTFDLS